MAVVRRFIAGARCPTCGAEDAIALNIEGEHEWICCIQCDFREDKPKSPPATAAAGDGAVQIIQLDG
ncbi:MAG: YheV family putative metal-binding protein [Gammaproteobacteria bacterium]|nr:YheV family putative metal-binding protein [Gammaproteobacteria bacterium]